MLNKKLTESSQLRCKVKTNRRSCRKPHSMVAGAKKKFTVILSLPDENNSSRKHSQQLEAQRRQDVWDDGSKDYFVARNRIIEFRARL
ncbi:hypothetical protein AVEN_156885-1 [Araneus ventricosus]|uniref:Uncharacterized protein n=1 Tax=Araneus ventricosus TaxID=182803 RepID=A0A4Y2ENF9_ARAVE|nr:hypothetical protein AVEN_156885-1 [Araneus ventricosus]